MAPLLILGVFFTFLALPTTEAKAGILSSIFGVEAYADINTRNSNKSTNNSQTMALLQANKPNIPSSKDKKDEENNIDENANIIVSGNALLPTTSPQSAFGGADNQEFSSDQVSVYEVKPGDTLTQVAEMFDVSTDTILSANDLKRGEKLKQGDVLLILPRSGIEHTVLKGQTLQGIANLYKVDVNELLFANDIEVNTKLAVGEKLIIPGVDMLNETTTIAKTKSIAKGNSSSSSSSAPSTSGYFKNPVPGAKRMRGIQSGHKGVDLAAPTGTAIHAAASGKVLIARNGYNGGFGNYVVVQHPNGCKTLYAHQSKLGTTAGAEVSQGQTIGYIGSTGHSTGPHLHIEVLGCKNPF